MSEELLREVFVREFPFLGFCRHRKVSPGLIDTLKREGYPNEELEVLPPCYCSRLHRRPSTDTQGVLHYIYFRISLAKIASDQIRWSRKDRHCNNQENHLWEEGPWLDTFPEVPEIAIDPPATPPDHLHLTVPPSRWLWVVNSQGQIILLPNSQEGDELLDNTWWSTWWCKREHKRGSWEQEDRERRSKRQRLWLRRPAYTSTSSLSPEFQPRN